MFVILFNGVLYVGNGDYSNFVAKARGFDTIDAAKRYVRETDPKQARFYKIKLRADAKDAV